MDTTRKTAATRKRQFLDFSFGELTGIFERKGLEPYRLKQVTNCIFSRHIPTFKAMTELPIVLRDSLAEKFDLRRLTVTKVLRSNLDGTVKLNFKAEKVEPFAAVFLPHERYHTLCVSSQVGCAFQCAFCASGTVRFKRNLSSGEILDQVFLAEEETKQKVQNILFMGMGEPLANFDSVVKAVRWMTSPYGFGMSPSRVTVSTTGLAPGITALAREKLNVNLALSLHAPTDKLRQRIVPVSSQFSIEETLKACKTYLLSNRGDFTIEYVLLKDVNDDVSHARELADLLRSDEFPRITKINLIPYNPVKGIKFLSPDPERVKNFFTLLKRVGFLVHTRKPQGQDIMGACGQIQ